ncbi:Uma2 family endonuclease [Streptomyces tritici]|uniref:Uma2 family endonuclease n=1 Tax=Streptomyces tritici TaxID=2054410 RepID=UPI003AF004FA
MPGQEYEGVSLDEAFQLFSSVSPRGWRVELIECQVHVTGMSDGGHATAVAELTDQVVGGRLSPTLRPYTGIGLRTRGRHGTECFLPDLVVAPKGSFDDQQEWHVPDAVLLVGEVTCASTAGRDRVQKIRCYARAGIPVYLLIDREAGEAVVCSEPDGDDYAHKAIHKLGTKVPLPAPLGFVLDSAEF